VADEIATVLTAVKSYLVTNLVAIVDSDVTIAWPDDRVAGSDEVAATKLTLAVYEFAPDPENDYSGVTDTIVKDLLAQPPTAQVTRKGHPYRLGIQVDTFCRTKVEDWQILFEYSRLISSAVGIAVDFGGGNLQTLYPTPELGDNQDDLTDEGFHKVLRFTLPLWLDDARAAEVVALITLVTATINISETIQVQEE
jgi:hypothetical protein